MKKKVSKKLSIHRDTITRLEKAATMPRGGAPATDEIGYVSSCTYECGCEPTGCSAEVRCFDQ